MKIIASRYHDFCMGHRVVGHEGKCKNFHGHNYRFTFECECLTVGGLDVLGRVIDFSVIKSTLCQWLEENWDHKMMLWDQDPYVDAMKEMDNEVFSVPFNPTAENIGKYFLEEIAPELLLDTGVSLTRIQVEETRKCSAIVEL